jgi:hypothetical protein
MRNSDAEIEARYRRDALISAVKSGCYTTEQLCFLFDERPYAIERLQARYGAKHRVAQKQDEQMVEPPLPDTATAALPGSAEKVQVMAARVAQGKQPFHAHDRDYAGWRPRVERVQFGGFDGCTNRRNG